LHRLPVLARPQTLFYRASAFGRRNRAATTIAAASLCALLALLGRLAWQVQETEAARRETVARFAEVRQLANRLVFSYHDRIVNLAGALPVREALLSDALSYLDSMARSAPRDPALARELAQTYQRVALLYGETFSASLERVADAEASLDKALALLPLYVQAPDVDVDALGNAVDMWLMRAQLHARQGRLHASVQALEQARPLAQQAATRAPADLQVLSRLATLAGRQAQALGGNPTLANLGKVAEAGQQWRVALTLFDRMVAQEPQSASWHHQLGWALSGITAWAILAGRHDEATRHGARLVVVRDTAAALLPDDAHLRYQAAMARVNYGAALSAAGRHAEAAQTLDQGHAAIAAIARADPANRSAARDLPLVDIARGRQLVTAGQMAQARAVLEQVLRDLPSTEQMAGDFYMLRWRAEAGVWLARSLVAAAPQAALLRAREAELAMLAGPARAGDGRAAVADAELDQDNAARRWARAQALGEQAQALLRLRQPAQARSAAQQALAAWGDSAPASMAAWAERDRILALAP
jgi:tetratricopeptide (TPR) repeat protein